MLRASAYMALFGGITLSLAEMRANWGDWQWWPWWLVDFVAAGLLICGAVLTLQSKPRGPALLTAAWGFALGMGWMSLASNYNLGPDPARDARMGGAYLALLSFGVLFSLSGLLLALFGGEDGPKQHG